MLVVADRFLTSDERGAALDLATGDRVRLFVDAHASPVEIAARTATCDRLATLRHPLLAPLVDYGLCGRRWFEAHAAPGPVRMSADQLREAVLHVVRFLRAAGVELTSELAARNIRTPIEGGPASGRPLGVFLRDRDAVDAVRTVLEAAGPSGTTAIALVAPEGGGLRTARLQIARLARLAGYVVLAAPIDPSASSGVAGRHVCVLDWLPFDRSLPAALAAAAMSGGRRHIWIRFDRPLRAAIPAFATEPTLRLEPLMNDDLLSAIFLDPELGPTAAEVRMAVDRAHGWPGLAIEALAGLRGGRGAGWVHETSPDYGAPATAPVVARTPPPAGSAGIGRLARAVAGAQALAARGRHARAARVLTKCGPALAARGAPAAAASAFCDLGELMLERGQPMPAFDAFEQARGWSRETPLLVRILVGSGRALLDLGRLTEAEAAFRTAAAGSDGARQPVQARIWLAKTLWYRGQPEAARVTLADACPALLSRVLLSMGQTEAAGQAAREALAAGADDDPAHACEARLAAARVQAVMGEAALVSQHVDEAARLARAARNPALRLLVAAERVGCLDRCGVSSPPAVRDRLVRAASRLPPLAAAEIRLAVQRPTRADAMLLPVRRHEGDLMQRFRALVDAIHDAPDDVSALQVIAGDLARALDACSVAIRFAGHRQIVASAGRPWAGEAALAVSVLNGGSAIVRNGVTPDIVEPVRAAGALIGSIALRWVAGAHPGWDRVREVLALSAVAAAPMLRALKTPAMRAESDAGFPDDLFGASAPAERVREAIRRAAAASYPVLVEGESGSGKELVARAIHARGVRRGHRFCAVNCAALTEDLLEAELFGHARGAFTGAMSERAGLFEEADHGTLFLDEIGELSARAQAKLLRVLQEGEVRRVGENVARRVDVRIVAATNRSLEEEADAGRFRADLRFRLDVIRIVIPPLRERADDLPWLAERIWTEAAAHVGSRATLGEDVMAALSRYDWPGNVRELQNVIASIAVHGPRRGRVPVAILPARIAHEAGRTALGFDEARLDFERRFVRAALARAGGRRATAAAHLKVSRQGLVKIIKRLGLE